MKYLLFRLLSRVLTELGAMREDANTKHKETMKAIDDLTAAITALSNTTTTLTASVDAAIADIQQLSPTEAQLAALTQSIQTVNATLQAQSDRLNSAVASPTPPTQ